MPPASGCCTSGHSSALASVHEMPALRGVSQYARSRYEAFLAAGGE